MITIHPDKFAIGSLAWLIHPVKPEEFFTSYWESRPLLIKRNEPSYYDELPGLEQFDGLITATAGAKSPDGRMLRKEPDGRLSRRSFKLTFDGRPDIQDIYHSYSDGYTVVLDRIEARSPVVGALCRRLEADLHQRVGANFYLTPRGSQGSDLHVDSHDVIIAHVHGTKKWRVATEACRLSPEAVSRKPIQISASHEYLLRPGDGLYIPRGYAHEARTETSSSLHLTIGINVLTWSDLLKEALLLLAETNPDLQKSLPYGYLSHPFGTSDSAVLSRCLSVMSLESVIEAARLSLGTKFLRRQAATTGHFRSLDLMQEMMSDSLMTRGFDGPCRTRSVDEQVIAEYAGNYVSVPRSLAPVLEYTLTTPTFTVSSMPCELSETAKIELAKRLIREGFLSIVNQPL